MAGAGLEEMLGRAEDAARADAPGEAHEEAQGEQADAAREIPRETLVPLLGQAVRAVGGVACRWRKVTPLDNDECGMIGSALYDLIGAYGALGQLDERTAAWLVLGCAIGSVIGNRRPIIEGTAQRVETPAADEAATAT